MGEFYKKGIKIFKEILQKNIQEVSMGFTNISYFNQQGLFSSECKDAVFYIDDGSTAVYSLADGLNSKQLSKAGAKAIQEEISSFFLQEPFFIFNAPIDWVKMAVAEKIRDTILLLTEGSISEEEFASTLLVVVISKSYNKCLWFHIGDGVILKQADTAEASIDILSQAHNGVTSQYTYTTVHQPLRKYLHCGLEELNDIKRLILATDGAILPYYSHRKISEKGQQLFQKGLYAVYEDLQLNYPKDDYSMLEVSITD